MSTNFDLNILQGKTLIRVYRFEALPIVYKPITGITKAAPVSITAVAHGIPEGWRAAVVSALGMTQINATNRPLRDSDFHKISVTDVNTVTINDINAAEFSTYASGGYLVYNTPVDLTGLSARMTIRDRIGGTLLASYTTATSEFAIDLTAKTITLTVAASVTAGYSWLTGVYDIELFTSGGTPVVYPLAAGSVTVFDEVTT